MTSNNTVSTNHAKAMLEIRVAGLAAKSLAARMPKYRGLLKSLGSHELLPLLPSATRGDVNEVVDAAIADPHFAGLVRTPRAEFADLVAVTKGTQSRVGLEAKYASVTSIGFAQVTGLKVGSNSWHMITMDPPGKFLRGRRHENPVYFLAEPGFFTAENCSRNKKGEFYVNIPADRTKQTLGSFVWERQVTLEQVNERLAALGRS